MRRLCAGFDSSEGNYNRVLELDMIAGCKDEQIVKQMSGGVRSGHK